MTQDGIIEMANQAELCQCIWIDDEGPEIASLVAFAKLVAAKERAGCVKRAKVALLGTLQTTSDRVLAAIRKDAP